MIPLGSTTKHTLSLSPSFFPIRPLALEKRRSDLWRTNNARPYACNILPGALTTPYPARRAAEVGEGAVEEEDGVVAEDAVAKGEALARALVTTRTRAPSIVG